MSGSFFERFLLAYAGTIGNLGELTARIRVCCEIDYRCNRIWKGNAGKAGSPLRGIKSLEEVVILMEKVVKLQVLVDLECFVKFVRVCTVSMQNLDNKHWLPSTSFALLLLVALASA